MRSAGGKRFIFARKGEKIARRHGEEEVVVVEGGTRRRGGGEVELWERTERIS